MDTREASRRPDPAKDEFLKLFLAHQRPLYALILAMVPHFADADDILQEVSTVLWQKFDAFVPGPDSSFMAWASTIARYEVLRLRRDRATGPAFSDDLAGLIADRAIDVNRDDDRRVVVLQACMGELDDRQRTLMSMRYVDDLRPKQIAARRSESVDAVYKILARTHTTLLHCIRRKLALASSGESAPSAVEGDAR